VYVADRLVLPNLTTKDIEDVAAGRHPMDAHVRTYIHNNLGYRFVMLPDGAAAFALETSIKNGSWPQGKPLLNLGSAGHTEGPDAHNGSTSVATALD
jgi:hypothetical protein